MASSIVDSLYPWKDKNIAIVGDLILDKYIYGYVDRVSPEAPVLVLNETGIEYRLGGAANVALNVLRLGGRPHLFGAIGNDTMGKKFKVQLLEMVGISDAWRTLFELDNPTTIKTRYVSGSHHQLLRVDRERYKELDKAYVQTIFSMIDDGKYDAIIVSDYNKGVVTELLMDQMVWASKKKKIPCLVDPSSQKGFRAYSGSSLITPNHKEAATALGVDHTSDPSTLAEQLQETLAVDNVIVTAGERGMYLNGRAGKAAVSSRAQEVYDVSGAGDTVISALSLAISCGVSMQMAMKIATCAAGIAISHPGTYAPSFDELIERVRREEKTGWFDIC